MKKKLLAVILCVALVVTGLSAYTVWRLNRVPTEIRYASSNTTHNINDPREVVGLSTYVFVGMVREVYDYYKDSAKREFPELIHSYDNSFTECVVTVLQNIKGGLKIGETFSFYKGGGISKDRKYILLYENDFIPEVGKMYIFRGGAHPDGTVTGGGGNGTIAIEAHITEKTLSESAVVQKYQDAYKNQIVNDDVAYPAFLSKTDVHYGDGSQNKKMQAEYEQLVKERDAERAAKDKELREYEENLIQEMKEKANAKSVE